MRPFCFWYGVVLLEAGVDFVFACGVGPVLFVCVGLVLSEQLDN